MLLRVAERAETQLQVVLTRTYGLSQARGKPLVFALVIGVILMACRGLLGGEGGYLLYVDPALPASHDLLHNICDRTSSQWATDNLGERVLFPSEYLLCSGINLALDAGVPAWFLSRYIPVISLLLAGIGMAYLLLFAIERGFIPVGSTNRTWQLACVGLFSIGYALSPYSFNELAASHFAYVVALAAFPWTVVVLLKTKRAAVGVVLAATLLALAYSQPQFFVLAPLGILIVAGVFESGKLLRRGMVACALATVLHLPWLLPLISYDPSIQASDYLLPTSASILAVDPIDALRLTGFAANSLTTTVASWQGLWSAAAVVPVVLAAIGLMALRWSRLFVVVIVGGAVFFEWSVRAPGYSTWSRFLPTALNGLLRERYALSFLVLLAIAAAGYVGLMRVRAATRWGAILAGCATLAALAGPFADGHLGTYGAQRADFNAATAATAFIRQAGGGTVLTIPFGSIVRDASWEQLGRSPFSQGGPDNTLDVQGAPGSPVLPLLTSVVNDLQSQDAGDRTVAGELLRMLRVRWVVNWKTFEWDAPLNRTVVLANLDLLGARRAFTSASVDILELPAPKATPSDEARSIYVESQVHPGATSMAASWHAPLALSTRGDGRDVLLAAAATNSVIHVVQRRLRTQLNHDTLSVAEDVWLADGRRFIPAIEEWSTSVGPDQTFAYSDGAIVPRGQGVVDTNTPAEDVFAATTEPALGARQIASALPMVQNTNDADQLGVQGAGISATSVPVSSTDRTPAVDVSALRDEAGLPLDIARPAMAHELTFEARVTPGRAASARFVADGATSAETAVVPPDGAWHPLTLHIAANPTRRTLYVYFYVSGDSSNTAPQTSHLQLRHVDVSSVEIQGPAISFQTHALTLDPNARSLVPATTQLRVNVVGSSDPVQDTAATTPMSLSDAGIRSTSGPEDPVGQRSIAIFSLHHQAGLPIHLSSVAGLYSLNIETRHVSGADAHVAIVADGRTTLAVQTLPRDPQWRTTTLQYAVSSEAHSIYLYTYVDGSGTAPPSEELIATVTGTYSPPFPDVVISAGGADPSCLRLASTALTSLRPSQHCPEWVANYVAHDPWWHPAATQHLAATPLLASGFGSTWVDHGTTDQSGANGPAFVYLPTTLFERVRLVVLSVWGVALAASFLFICLAHWPRRRHRKR